MPLTHKRDLKTGRPVWLASKPRFKSQRCRSGTSADVIVVGSGISGALAAITLQAAGFSVLCVDRRRIMSGSTPGSTALLQSELDTPLRDLQLRIGKAR